MAVVTLRTRGAAAPDIVWERYADLALWPTWSPQLQRVETSAARLAPGISGTVRAGLLSWPTLPVPFVVEDVDTEARTWSWRVRVGLITLRLAHGVEPAAPDSSDGARSSTWLRLSGPSPLVTAYAPVARLALRRLVAAPAS